MKLKEIYITEHMKSKLIEIKGIDDLKPRHRKVLGFYVDHGFKKECATNIGESVGLKNLWDSSRACVELYDVNLLSVTKEQRPKRQFEDNVFYTNDNTTLFLIKLYGKEGYTDFMKSKYYKEMLTDEFLNECIFRLAIRWFLNPEMKEKIRTLQSKTIERELKSHKKKRPEIELGKSNEFISIILKSNNVSECMDRLKSRGFGLKKGENPLSNILDDQDIQAFKIISKCSPSTLKASFENNPLPFPPYYKIMYPPKRRQFFIIIFVGLMRYLFGLYFQYDMTTTHGTRKAYEKLSKEEHQLIKMFLD